jgi:hypothetical protein
MRSTMVVPMMILIISAILSGCIFKPEEKLLPENWNKDNMSVKYMENRDPIITKNDFPDFKLTNHLYFVSLKNASLTLETEGSHQSGSVNSSDINISDEIPVDYRLYGGSESYKSNDRYILLQYKVFDKDDRLNDSMNMTVYDYTQNGFKYMMLNNASYKGRIFLLQSNVTNRTDMNVTVILFGYDTVIGKIGVQDSKDKSLNESLKILNIISDRLKIGVENVSIAKTGFGTHGLSNQSGN